MTKVRLYPKGSAFYTTLPIVDAIRPKTFAIQDAMNASWDMCQALVNVSLTIGTGTIARDLQTGFRYDVSNNVIPHTTPLTLVDGVTLNYTSGDEFASPLKAASVFVPGASIIGNDVTYGDAQLLFQGELYHSNIQAQPVITLSALIVSAGTGFQYNYSISEPVSANKITGNFLSVDGTLVPSWIEWSGGAPAALSGLVTVTTTQSFIWP